MAKHNQPTSNPSNLGSAAGATPTEDTSVSFTDKSFCTGKIEVIGVHLGYILGTYSNKDGSGGLFITDGTSCFHIDENKNIHLQTGKTVNDGANGGNMVLRADMLMDKFENYVGVFSGVDDESSVEGDKEETNPAYSLVVYGNMDIVTHGEAKIKADNILVDAEDQLKLKANQIILQAADGGGKINFLSSEVTTTSKSVKYDLTTAFYVDGPEEITFNQKIKADPVSGSVNVNSPGATIASNTIGSKNDVVTGNYKHLNITGNSQFEAYKTLFRDLGGTSTVSLGPFVQYGLGQYDGAFVGTPRENSRTVSAYELKVGGAIGTSYNLTAGDVNIDTPGTITGTSISFVDFIGSLILLN